MSQPRIFIRTSYADTYRNIPVSAFQMHSSDKGFELTAYVDEEDFTPAEPPQANSAYIKRTIETRMTISPMQMMALHDLIGRQIKSYEEVFGKIMTFQELQEKMARKQKAEPSSSTTSNISNRGNVGVG